MQFYCTGRLEHRKQLAMALSYTTLIKLSINYDTLSSGKFGIPFKALGLDI